MSTRRPAAEVARFFQHVSFGAFSTIPIREKKA